MSEYTTPSVAEIRAPTLRSLELVAASIARLDERIHRLGPIGEGYRARIEYQEACALRAQFGEFVALEDLVLLDAGAPIRMSTIETTRARLVLQARRSAAGKAPIWAWSDEALFDDRIEVEKDELLIKLGDDVWDEHERVERWREVFLATTELPPALRAAIAWDAWLQLEPIAGAGWRSGLVAAAAFRLEGIAKFHLPIIGTGGRRSRYRYDPRDKPDDRVAGFCDWVTLALEEGEREIQRLVLAHQVLTRVAQPKHRDSRLPALIDLFTVLPLVSAELAKDRLKISSTGFRKLREALGTSVREMSGRGRYRVWGLR